LDPLSYINRMAFTNVNVAEDALSLSPADRAELAKLLIQSLESDTRTDEAIKADLASRLEQLRSGADPGLTFKEVFKRPL
jgi:putative addiction module component (TIGR02574 family)